MYLKTHQSMKKAEQSVHLPPWLLSAQTFAKAKKAVYVIVDGIPADQIERLQIGRAHV